MTTARFPHCDARVLHEPKNCEFCDMFPELQQERIKNNINFTGEGNPNKKPCPAEAARGLKSINSWYGNVAKPAGCPKCEHPGEWINLGLTCPTHGPF